VKKDKLRLRRLCCTNNLLDILDPFLKFSTPPAQPTGSGSELFAHHFRLLALPVGIVTGPAPPKDAFLSESENGPPRLITSRTTGLSVPHKPGNGPVTYPWEIKDERWVQP